MQLEKTNISQNQQGVHTPEQNKIHSLGKTTTTQQNDQQTFTNSSNVLQINSTNNSNNEKHRATDSNILEGLLALWKLFSKNHSNADNLLDAFRCSLHDAFTFIENFNEPDRAIEWLTKIYKSCDRATNNFCGNNYKWVFDERTNALFIRGTGNAPDCMLNGKDVQTPWNHLAKQIQNVFITNNVKQNEDCSFYKCLLNNITTTEHVPSADETAAETHQSTIHFDESYVTKYQVRLCKPIVFPTSSIYYLLS